MSFNDRLKKSEIAITKFVEYCKKKNINYAHTGYEFLKSSSGYFEKIKQMTDNTSKFIRYYPDLTILNKESWLIEVKNSVFIERQAYDVYMELSVKYNVGLVIWNNEKLLFTNIKNIIFKIPSFNNIPIIDNFWAYPSKLSTNEFIIWKNTHKGSGTPFAIININNFKLLSL